MIIISIFIFIYYIFILCFIFLYILKGLQWGGGENEKRITDWFIPSPNGPDSELHAGYEPCIS
jgi:hypothetical protein